MAKRKAPTATPTSEPPRKTRPTHLEPDVEHEESPESPPSSTLSPGAELDGSLRVLRAVEQIVVDGGDTVETTEDFTIPACFLQVSDVLAPLADENENVLSSNDKVIQMHDTIESVSLLVDWLTRTDGFTFNSQNFPIFILLADKYGIDSLHQDLVYYSYCVKDEIRRKKNTDEVSEKDEYRLWKLAGAYEFRDLEVFLRKRCEKLIYQTIATEGIWKLRDEGISSVILDLLVKAAATSHLNRMRVIL